MRREEPTGQDAADLVPTRDDIAQVYRVLRAAGGWTRGDAVLCAATEHWGADVCTVLLSLDILRELKLIEQNADGEIILSAAAAKVDLEDSSLLRAARLLTSGDLNDM